MTVPLGSQGPTILRKLVAGSISLTPDFIVTLGPEQGIETLSVGAPTKVSLRSEREP